jgi:hypothetical protein
MPYRWLLSLYPYEFRQTYRDELEADFEEARREAEASGPFAVTRLWLRVFADLIVSVPREWLRTPWLAVLTAAAIAAATVFYYVVGRVYRAGSFAAAPQPPESPQLVLLMGLMVLVPAAALVLIAAASQFFRVRSPGRRRRV